MQLVRLTVKKILEKSQKKIEDPQTILFLRIHLIQIHDTFNRYIHSAP